jgi:hypothetical protein
LLPAALTTSPKERIVETGDTEDPERLTRNRFYKTPFLA